MKPVNQKIISNVNGDCFGACVASIFELDEIPQLRKGPWLDIWNEWLENKNLQIVISKVGDAPPPKGYCILSVKSSLFQGVYHAVVFLGDGYYGNIVHNPNPNDPRKNDIPNEDWESFRVFALLDPSIGCENS